MFQGTKLALTVWFLAIYLISQAKTGLSALALKRHLGVSYPTAWLVHHKLMQAMVEREERYVLDGEVQVDDAYLGGERTGGTAGRGSENKVPFLAAVSVDPDGHPVHAKLTPVPGFTRKAVADWASSHVRPGSVIVSDGLACFNGVRDAGCQHQPVVVGTRKPRDLPDFLWVNTVLGNVKTSLAGAYHAFDFGKYATQPRRHRLSLQPPLPVGDDHATPGGRRDADRAASAGLAATGCGFLLIRRGKEPKC